MRSHHPAAQRDLRFPKVDWFFRDEISILLDLVFNRNEVVMGLLEGIFSGFRLSFDLDEKVMRGGLLDLTAAGLSDLLYDLIS